MRIAVHMKDRCQPKKCNHECHAFCPRVRSGDETVVIGDRGYPVINEHLCVGCGICVHKCPFDAIKIINLAEQLEVDLVHQYGQNGFRLFRLPTPLEGKVVGLLGPNGIGKTTVLRMLSGEEVPNFGEYEISPSWEKVLEHFAGTQIHDYLKMLSEGAITVAVKPQYVDKLPKAYSGKVRSLLEKVTLDSIEKGKGVRFSIEDMAEMLQITHVLDSELSNLSGGELQRVAIGTSMMKEADIYFFDEPSSYLDIFQRLRIAKMIQKLGEEKHVVVIEHDLAILDFLADIVHIMYGSEGAYGVTAFPEAVRSSINTYLNGFLRAENIRFRDRPIIFEPKPPRQEWVSDVLINFDGLKKTYDKFSVSTGSGAIHTGEVIGIVGPNATGKTTFVQMLAGVVEPTEGYIDATVKVSYKPQYIKGDFEGTVQELFFTKVGSELESSLFKSEIERPLSLQKLYHKRVKTLSGGELQRVAIALCLTKEAEIYLIDEPSAYLDSNQRMEAAKTIRRVIEKKEASGLIVDHDVYFIDLISDSLMVFTGESSKFGIGLGPFNLHQGMNKFLENVDITFRRDMDTNRPRINKPGSRLDREQKAQGEYYYTVQS